MQNMPTADPDLAQLVRTLFSPRPWRTIGFAKGEQELAETVVRISNSLSLQPRTRGDVVQGALKWMRANFRNDYVYREALLNSRRRPDGVASATYITEVHLATSIADVIRAGREMEVFEIKSDLDSSRRLLNQISNAYTVSPYFTLVTSRANAQRALRESAASPIGISIVGPMGGLVRIRKPRARWQRLDPFELYSLLRADERAFVLRKELPYLREVPNALQFQRGAEIVALMSPVELYSRVVGSLRRRHALPVPDHLRPLTPVIATLRPSAMQLKRISSWIESDPYDPVLPSSSG